MKLELARIVIPVIILAAGVGAFVVLGSKAEEKRKEAEEKLAAEVEVVKIDSHEGELDISVDGQVVPYQEITLSAEVAGRIVEKAEVARAGRFARKDTVLFQIDEEDYDLAVRQLENELKQADVSVQELDDEIRGADELVELAKRQLALAQNDLDRQSQLHRRGVSSNAERDQAQRDFNSAQNALTTVKNQLSLLTTKRSRLVHTQELTALKKKKAEHDLARTEIKAPLDGVIVSDAVEEGDYVNMGTQLVTIEDTAAVEVKCNLQMDELYWIWDQSGAGAETGSDGASRDYQIPPTRATIVYRLQDTEYVWDGMLWRIEGVGLDERTRTVPCRVIVRSPRTVSVRDAKGRRRPATDGPPALVRGMYVDVEVHVKPKTQLLSVPESAVRPGNQIWVAEPIRPGESPAAEDRPNGATHRVQIVDVRVVEVIERVEEESPRPEQASPGEGVEVERVVKRFALLKADPRQAAEGHLVITSPLATPTVPSDAGDGKQEGRKVIPKDRTEDAGRGTESQLAPRDAAPRSTGVTEKVS